MGLYSHTSWLFTRPTRTLFHGLLRDFHVSHHVQRLRYPLLHVLYSLFPLVFICCVQSFVLSPPDHASIHDVIQLVIHTTAQLPLRQEQEDFTQCYHRRCRMASGCNDIWQIYAVGAAAAGGGAIAVPVGAGGTAASVDTGGTATAVDAGGTAAAVDAGGAAAGSVDAGGAAALVDAGGTVVSVGAGGPAVSVGTGAAVSVGTGAAVSVGAGTVVSVGAGVTVSVGAGTAVSVGAGAVVSVGAGTADVTGGAAPPVAAAAATKMLKLNAVGVGLKVYPSGLSSMTVALSRVSVPCMNPFGVSVMLNLFTPGCTSNDCVAVSPVASMRLPGAVASTTAQS